MIGDALDNSVPVVECRDLTKAYTSRWKGPSATVLALNKVSFCAGEGTIIGLIGPNGAGKTTFLSLIAGLIHPTEGEVRIGGHKPRSMEAKRHLGYVPESPAFLARYSARAVLRYHAALHGLSRAEIEAETDWLLERVKMQEYAGRAVGGFSQGMRQRLALAVALIGKPTLLLLDEPSNGLDPIVILHIAWLGTYAAIFLIPFPPALWNWGGFLFGWSGCMLPLLISAGIFGDDIASGRIGLLVTKPIRSFELYAFRLLGLSLQGAIHLTAAGLLIFSLHRLTGRGNAEHLATWTLAAWLIFNTWAALSTSVSVVVKRERNAMLVFVGVGMIFFALNMIGSFFPEATVTKVLVGGVRYACPPVEFLVGLAKAEHAFLRGLGDVGHSLILTVIYAVLGIILLGVREFKRVSD